MGWPLKIPVTLWKFASKVFLLFKRDAMAGHIDITGDAHRFPERTVIARAGRFPDSKFRVQG